MLRQKKGFLLAENVVKILIAVLCILVLIVLGYKLFSMFSMRNNENRAIEQINSINDKINVYFEQETTEPMYVMIFPPGRNLLLVNFEKGFFPVEQCVGRYESCLCMCEKVGCEAKTLMEQGLDKEYVCDRITCSGLKGCIGMNLGIFIDSIWKNKEDGNNVRRVGLSSDKITYHEQVLALKEEIDELKIIKQDEKIIIKETDRDVKEEWAKDENEK